MIGKKISDFVSYVLGQVMMWCGSVTIIIGCVWLTVKMWASVIHMIFG